MKNLLFSAALLLTLGLSAQNQNSCFIQYYDMFDKRKADPVPDGMQNVVVTIRDTKANTCITYQGKIEVKANQIAGKLTLKNTRGEYVKPGDKLNAKYQAPVEPLKADFNITNGMTANFLTKEMKVVNLFFIDYLKKQAPSLVEAPPAKQQ